ncbi:MAG TPA: NUMOD4 domain-containing protein [Nitrososphaeraceae archaeon]|nr:NUMOD4 domain-containing protein [Nitrososphaeraceae archaeon]
MIEYHKNLSLENLHYINEEGLDCIEEFRDIPDYEGLYQVSDLGRVKSLSRVILKNGKYPFESQPRILKANLATTYLKVNLYKEDIVVTKSIHQLEAVSFLNHTPWNNDLVVNHKNFIRWDNRFENLEIVTKRENGNQKHLESTSKYTGVSWSKSKNKWSSVIYVDGKSKHLGYFDDELEASKYYENAFIAIQNGDNIKVKHTEFSSKYKGVYYHQATSKWKSRILLNKIDKFIGSFDTELEAYEAREKYKKELQQ